MKTIANLISFAKSSLNHAKDNFQKVTLEMYDERLTICGSCDRFDEDNWICKECECYLTIKANWKSESCPLSKWPNDDKPRTNQRKCCGN